MEVLYLANSSGSFHSRDLIRDFVRTGIGTLQRLPPCGGRRRLDNLGTSLVSALFLMDVASLEIERVMEMVAEGVV